MILGITGKKFAGKDTFAKGLQLYAGVYTIAFAKYLKDAARVIFALSNEQLHGSLKEELDERWGMTPREIMQKLGTEIGRNIREDVWIKRTFMEIGEKPLANWAITDVRFPNEVEAVRAQGGVIVKIWRPQADTGHFESHASEIYIDDIRADYDVVNGGTMSELWKDGVAICQALGIKPT